VFAGTVTVKHVFEPKAVGSFTSEGHKLRDEIVSVVI
jgi:hypothetical protein